MTIFQRISQIGRFLAKWSFTPVIRGAVPALVCLLMLAAATVAGAQTSLTTYWVAPSTASPAGNDSNAGTQAAPWLTFKHAAAIATAGDTVIFEDGTYGNTNNTTGYMVDMTTSGNVCGPNNAPPDCGPITFKAQHRGMAILDGGNTGGSTCDGAAGYLDLDTASYIVIQGFVIRNTCTLGIDDNHTSTNVTLRWNEIYDIATGIDPGTAYGNAAFYCGTDASDVVLEGNSIHDIGRVPNATHWDNDDGLNINCPNVTIINNIFYNQAAGQDLEVSGPQVSGQTGAQNILIANNTFGPIDPNDVNPEHSGLYGEVVVWGGGLGDSVSGITFKNNIFNAPQDTGHYTAIYGLTPNVTNCRIDANLVTNTASLWWANDAETCTEGTHNVLNAGSTGVMSAPGSPATGGYDLVSGSPAIDAGFTIGVVNSDYARRCRPQVGSNYTPSDSGYDIGAYQYPQTCE